jgi:hypothetical protein
MSGRDITAVIGQKTYYEQVGETKSFQNTDNQDVNAYLVKITKAEDKNREGKYALIKSTKQAGTTSSSDQYVTDITYGEQCDLLGKINTADTVNLQTRTFNGTVSVDDLSKGAGAKKPEDTTGVKGWTLAANKSDWKALGASVPDGVTTACANPAATGAAAAGSVPAVSKPNLGEVNADDANAKVDIKFDKNIAAVDTTGNISINVNGTDKTLASGGYTIAGDTLSINKAGIDALGITNATADNQLIVNADQIADAADTTKKNVATGELALQAKAPAAAPDTNPTANIKTLPDSEFPQSGPIELAFENPIQVADNGTSGKKLDATRIVVMEADDSGNQISGTEQNGLTYEVVDGNKLKISQPSGSKFKPATKYKILIQPGTFLNDDGKKANADFIPYTFKAVTPVVKKK